MFPDPFPPVATDLPASGSRRSPSIGYLIDGVEDTPYHWQILRGAMQEAQDRGAHFVVFVGGALNATGAATGSNWVYELARPGNVDALALSGSLGNAAGSKALAEFCARCPPMPICSIALPLPGASSVCLDNAAGMRAVVAHLLDVHGMKQIAFVRGPAASDEAELRLRVYRETLQSRGVAYDPLLVVGGDFMPPAGRKAVATLFDERKIPVTAVRAIVAANDAMATGVVEGLTRRGIRIPEQIAVTGFDDVQEARLSNPPLTTVAQPLGDQGRECIRILMDQLRGVAPSEHVVRSPELITRRSCGCSSTPIGNSLLPSTDDGFDAAFQRDRQRILADMQRAGRGVLAAAGAQWEARLVDAAADQARNDQSNEFLRAYEELLSRIIETDGDVSSCSNVLSALRTPLLRCVPDARHRMRVEDFFHEARGMTTQAIERMYVAQAARAGSDVRRLMQAGISLLSARSFGELAHAVHEQMPRAGIERCYIARLGPGAVGQHTAQILLAADPQAGETGLTWSRSQPPADLLRDALAQSVGAHAFVVFPAALPRQEKAIVVLELGATEGYGYEVLRKIFTGLLSRLDPDSGAVPRPAGSGET